MTNKNSNVYQFKVTLKRLKPPIWRRILVPEKYTFWDLHVAIQGAMGWFDCHLHQFEVFNPKFIEKEFIGIPTEDFFDEVTPGDKTKISKYFISPGSKIIYEYDFGDSWEHEILFEKILPAIAGNNYPQCIDGKRACPPEDCGGVWGYEHLLEIIKKPRHEEYKSTIEWLGGKFDSELFDPKKVIFANPKDRLKHIM